MSKILSEELKQLETEISQLKKQLFIEMITEGVDDPGILKCIFLAGGPGSGKSYTAKEIFGVGKTAISSVSAGGLKLVNSDTALVIGSRYVPGGGVTNWPLFRRVLSKWGNLYTAFCLHLKIKDCTSGFRVYSAKSLKNINLDGLKADGYAFLSEMAFVISRKKLGSIVESPIVYVDRAFGESKMNTRIMRESMMLVTRWGFALRTGIGRKHLPR